MYTLRVFCDTPRVLHSVLDCYGRRSLTLIGQHHNNYYMLLPYGTANYYMQVLALANGPASGQTQTQQTTQNMPFSSVSIGMAKA